MAAHNNPSIQSATNNQKKSNKKYEFSIGSFNVWCPHWNGSESHHPQIWKKRHNGILNILCNNNDDKKKEEKKNDNNDEQKQEQKQKQNQKEKQPEWDAMNCDIYCIQEFWCARDQFVRLYENYFKARNYELHFLKRSAKHKPDGIAVLINKSSFEFIDKMEYKYTISNRVAIMMNVLHKKSNLVLSVGSTHLTFPSADYDAEIRKQQCSEFIDLLNKNTPRSSSLMILAGDFNCEIDGPESVACINDGYKSSFHVVNKNNDAKIISHFNHDHESVFVDHIFYKNNPNVAKDKKFTVNPIDSYLYPRNVDVHKWPSNKEWDLSDHRPLVSVFEVQQD